MSGGNGGYGGSPAASNRGSCKSESFVPASSAVAGPENMLLLYVLQNYVEIHIWVWFLFHFKWGLM